jgi:hypothetical protein
MKALRYLLLLTIVTGSVSCKKFLDTKPTDTLSPDYYYATEAQMNNSLTGVYDIMGAKMCTEIPSLPGSLQLPMKVITKGVPRRRVHRC